MTGVLIAADRTDKKMWKTFPAILCRNLGAYLQQSVPKSRAIQSDMVIGDASQPWRIPPDHSILIWKQDIAVPTSFLQTKSAVAIVDADADAQVLAAVSDTMLPAITCGMSSRDTLTLSSYGAEDAVVTLQRSLECFDGSVVEPQEIPIAVKTAIDSFTLMATAAVFLLTGNQKRLAYADFDPDECKLFPVI